MLYYHLDAFTRWNLSVPSTWEEYADLAEAHHGREGLFGSCMLIPGESRSRERRAGAACSCMRACACTCVHLSSARTWLCACACVRVSNPNPQRSPPSPPGCGSESYVLRLIYGSYVQTQGPSHGMYWDPETLEPLVNTPAMEAALKVGRARSSALCVWCRVAALLLCRAPRSCVLGTGLLAGLLGSRRRTRSV